MPSLERDRIEKSLQKKGFVAAPGDHRYFRLMDGEKYTGISTKTSRGTQYKNLSSELVSKMARQLWLSTQQFVSLVECTMSEEQYRAILAESGRL